MKISFEGFAHRVNDFYQYMGREKLPKPESKQLWFHKLRAYQQIEIEEAFEKMKDSLDSVPFNLPKAVKQAVFEVSRSKAAPTNEWKDYGPCDGCNGSGGFRLLIFDKHGKRFENIKYCSACENWRNYCNEPGDRMNSSELEGCGYRFKPLNKCLVISRSAKLSGSVEKLHEMANKSIKRI